MVLLLAAAACSADRDREPDVARTPDTTASTASSPSAEASAPSTAGPSTATPSPSASRGVTCLRVAEDMAAAIAARSIDPIRPVPGRAFAYRPLGLRGTYLVVMVFTGPGRPEPEMGVWAVRRSIEPDEHGMISSVDRIARYVTSWPVARLVVEEDFRVSEVRACTLV